MSHVNKHRPYKRAHSATVHSVTEHDQAVHSSAPVLAVRCKNRFKLAPQADLIWFSQRNSCRLLQHAASAAPVLQMTHLQLPS